MPRTLIPAEKIDKTKFEELRIHETHASLLFSDGTACLLIAESQCEASPEIEEATDTGYLDRDDLLKLGIISDEESDEMIRAANKQREEAVERTRLAKEERDRSEYQRLRAKYEPKPG